MASQTFIRREIAAIEAMGTPIKRYAVRGWDTPLIDLDDQSEAAKTRRILDVGIPRLLWALLATVVSRPRKFARALAESWRLGRQSDRGVVIHFAYLAEACVLRAWTQSDSIAHLHVHFGSNSATVALLCRLLGGPPYSFTVHGPEEFDRPAALGLRTKIRHAAFVVCYFNLWSQPALALGGISRLVQSPRRALRSRWGFFRDTSQRAVPGSAADQHWPAFGTKRATDTGRGGRSTSRKDVRSKSFSLAAVRSANHSRNESANSIYVSMSNLPAGAPDRK